MKRCITVYTIYTVGLFKMKIQIFSFDQLHFIEFNTPMFGENSTTALI
jgi:hypothetical protein